MKITIINVGIVVFLMVLNCTGLLHGKEPLFNCAHPSVTRDDPSEKIKKAYRQFLLQCHPDKRTKTTDAKTAHNEFVQGQKAYETLLSGDQSTGAKSGTSGPQMDTKSREAENMLSQATNRGDVKAVRELLLQGVSPNPTDISITPPLTMAIFRSNEPIVRLLLEYGADVNKIYEDRTPLMLAVEYGYLDIARLLLDHHADVNKGSASRNPLIRAVELNNNVVVKLLLDYHANPNVEYASIIPLMLAIGYGNVTLVELLLKHGANPNVRQSGDTPLMRAAAYNYPAIVKLLIDYGADVCAKQLHGGYTATIFAHSDVLKKLLECKKQ